MKKLMILGGSLCQRNAVLRGKALGYEMVLADYTQSPPAASDADLHIPISTFDAEGCIKAARDLAIDGVMTMGTDQPVLTTALTAEALCLPALHTPEQAKAITNKKVMKARFREHGLPTAEYLLVNESTDSATLRAFEEKITANGAGNVVLKPLDSQGQRGVFRLDSACSVQKHLSQTLAFSREREALLEEYYPSDELTISGWIENGKLTILTVTDRILLNDPLHIGICTSHRFPSKHMHRYEEIDTLCRKITEAFALRNGPLYVQLLLGDQGFLINEIAGRIGGAFEDIMIPEITGFSILDAVINSSLGMEADTSALRHYHCPDSRAHASVQLMFANPGKIAWITPQEQLLKLKDVIACGYNYQVGDQIKQIENATARFGHCVLVSKEGSLQPSMEAFRQTFQILDEKGNNLWKSLI